MAIPLAVGFWAVLSAVLPALIWRVIVLLGIGSVTFVGLKHLFDVAFQKIQDNFSALPPEVLEVVFVCRIDDALTLFFSAMSARMVLAGVCAAGNIQRVKWSIPNAPTVCDPLGS